MTLIVVHQQNPGPYADEFVELDFEKPLPIVPDDHVPDYSQQKGVGTGLIPEGGFGRWEDIKKGEGKLPEEETEDFKPYVSRWEQDAWDNGIDGDDMQKGPDPWGDDTYESVFKEALKVNDILFGI